MKKLSLIFIVCVLASEIVPASSPGTTAASFLKIGVGAKNIAMGETGAAAGDANSIYWNPAGISLLERSKVSLMHAVWLQEINYNYLAVVHPMDIGTLGAAVNYLSMSEIEMYDIYDTKLGKSYKPYDLALTLSYARKIREIPVGLNLKYIYSEIDKESANAIAFDLGAIYEGIVLRDEKLRVGLAIQNIGTRMKFVKEKSDLPLNFRRCPKSNG